MSIYEFINSHDISQHFEQIGYKPSPLEMAWLIWQSNNHDLLQKHSAYWTLIDNTDDCPIPAGIHCKEYESLHEFLILRQQLKIHLSSVFDKEEPDAVYSYRIYLDDDRDREWHSSSLIFRTFEEAYEHAQSEAIPLSPNFVEFVKTYIGKEEKQIFVRLNHEKRLVRMDENHYLSPEEHEIYHDVFEEMWFSFPHPFEKGEIDLALLLGAHKIMCYEELISETKGMLNYTQEGFELAEIEKKKKK